MANNESSDLAKNKKAYHLYTVLETYEAGIELYGTEVKSCRAHHINFKDAYADIRNDEIFVRNLHIGPYKNGTTNSHDPERKRKLLLHKKEILKLANKSINTGYTIVPLSVYTVGNKIKMKIGLVVGKKKYDKREDYKKKDAQLAINREIKKNLKGY